MHQKYPRPLTVFSTLSFNPGQPEVQPGSPFGNMIAPYGSLTNGSPEVQIDERFKVDEGDVVLRKTSWSATMGDSLEQILKAQDIKTVIIVCDILTLYGQCYTDIRPQSGLTLSGVVMSTIYRLFDLDYHVYVIRDNVLDLPVDQTAAVSNVMLDLLLPKMGFRVISIDEALQALEHS